MMPPCQVSYALLRIGNTRDQESKTVKFEFICYVGPNVGGMQRGRVGGHKGDVKELVGQSHVVSTLVPKPPWARSASPRQTAWASASSTPPPRGCGALHRPYRALGSQDIQTDDKDDISEDAITTKLKKASGANYDLGSNAGGDPA